MTTTYTWAIANLERHTADGIVFTVHWTVAANDGTYASSAYGSIGLEQPEGDIIPYADLTPEIVVFWVQEKLDVPPFWPHSKPNWMNRPHRLRRLGCRGRRAPRIKTRRNAQLRP
jgi:hypothetical protein